MTVKTRTRLHLLDTLRGFLLVNMIAFHGLWNLVYIFDVQCPWYAGTPKYLWQQFICWSFILLSGFCWRLSRSHLRRGLLVFGSGVAVTAVTCLMMPENRIVFGILTCIGSCVLLLIPLEKLLRRCPAGLGAGGSFLLLCLLRNCQQGNLGFERLVLCPLPRALYRNYLTAYLGFPQTGFYSTDYFPLIPWLFLFLCGYFLCRILEEKGLQERLFARGRVPILSWAGRNSLVVYLLHQPILYGLGLLYQLIVK